MLKYLKEAAEEAGINLFITNSEERIETQLNSLTRSEDVPTLLISWDINVSLNFNDSGYLDNPLVNIVALLVSKPYDTSKDEAEKTAEEMGYLIHKYLKILHDKLVPVSKVIKPITAAKYKFVPKYGAGKHSGVQATWTMISAIENC